MSIKNPKVHLVDPWDMKLLKEYPNIETASTKTAYNAPESVFLGVEGTPRAYRLSEFRAKFGSK